MSATLESKARTRAFARVIGPFMMLVPSVAAAAAPETRAFAAWLFADPSLARIAGCVLLLGGGLVVACHRHWSSAPAVCINLFAWCVAIRGAALVAMPGLVAHDASGALVPFPAVRLGFGLFFLAGVWLTFVGWSSEPAASGTPLAHDR